ncbi:MAG: nucleoside monophosphate kinase [Candidatus Parcubacteria bacterium]|nr:nucleoside monophosphate kinase [Candidatus Parcubacteria bacterium]
MLVKPYTFLFIGRSGCGKGTQAELLIKYLKTNSKRFVLYFYAGNKMRELAEKKNNLTAQITKKILLEGGKQPDFLAIWYWSNELVKKMTGDAHLVIDGSPRTAMEAEIWDEALKFYGRKNVWPIYVDVSAKWATERLLARKRFDDTKERVKNRMKYFDKFVYPAVEYYKKENKNKLIHINGEQTIEEVHQEIMQKVFND